MGMLVVSDDEFVDAINNCIKDDAVDKIKSNKIDKDKLNEILNGTVEQMHEHGRHKGDLDVPNSLRKVIGETSQLDGKPEAVELASRFGISRSSVSAYASGSTSTGDYDNKKTELVDHIRRSKDRVNNKARALLFRSLKHITEVKLENAKPEVLSGIAKDMSTIIKNNEPAVVNEGNNNAPAFVIYAPQFIKEDHFDTINVND